MENILIEIRNEVLLSNLDDEVKHWIFLQSRKTSLDSYGDFDVFAIISKNVNPYLISKKLSMISVKLTLKLGKYVSIFPINEQDFSSENSQFIKNIRSKATYL